MIVNEYLRFQDCSVLLSPCFADVLGAYRRYIAQAYPLPWPRMSESCNGADPLRPTNSSMVKYIHVLNQGPLVSSAIDKGVRVAEYLHRPSTASAFQFFLLRPMPSFDMDPDLKLQPESGQIKLR